MNRYQIVETAFGYGAVAFTIEPFGLLEVKFPQVDIDVVFASHSIDLYWQIDEQPSGSLVYRGNPGLAISKANGSISPGR
jgi:hypothetical protein